MRLLRGTRFAARGIIAGSLAALALLVLSRFGLLPVLLDASLPFIVAAAYAAGLGTSLFLASRRRIDVLTLARYAEQQLDLKERLSSALTLETSGGDVLVRLQRDDASHYAERIEPRVLIPWRLTWEPPAAIVSVLLVLLAAFLPMSPVSVTAPDRIARAETAREGSKLEEVARQVLRQSDQAAPPPVKDAARHLQKVARAMQSHQATRSQAVRELRQLSEQIKKANQQAAGSPASGPRPSEPDQPAQARAEAQRELDRALNADAKGNGRQGNGKSTRSQSNGISKNAGESQSKGTGTNASQAHSGQAQSGSKGNPPSSADHGSSASGSASAKHPGGANGGKPQGGVNDHQGGAKSEKPGSSGNLGASAKTNPTAQASSGKPGETSSGKPGAVGGTPSSSAQSNPQAQNGNRKVGNAPKSGKDLGKSAAPGCHPTTTKPATDGQLLGDKLRQYADKIAQRPMASGEREQAARSLDQLNQKLNDAKMPETQKHIQAAAQALREGRQQDAVSELRQAAAAADRETPVTEQKTSSRSSSGQPSSSSSSSGSQSPPQNGASQQMQRAVDQSKQNLSGQGKQSGQGQQPGQGQPKQGGSGQQKSGSPGNSPGSGSGKVDQPGSGQSEKQDGHGGGGTGPGGARNAASHPASKSLPKSGGAGTVVLTPSGPGGRMIEKPVSGKELPGSASSTVPYYHISPRFKKAAEKDAGAENIPPAYRQQVRKYFDALTPTHE